MFNKKINLQQLDRIILKEDDVKTIDETLRKYIDNDEQLKEKVREIPLKVSLKGLYVLEQEVKDNQLEKLDSLLERAKMSKSELEKHVNSMYYYELDKNMKISQLSKDGEIQFTIVFDENLSVVSLQTYHRLYSGESVKEHVIKLAKTNLAQILWFIQYSQLMVHLNEESSIIKRQAHIKGYQPKKPTKKEREREARKRVSVSKPKVDYDYTEAQREGETRSYNRIAESWRVDGHWRTYKKSGKRVFVKGHKKGIKGAETKGRDFTI